MFEFCMLNFKDVKSKLMISHFMIFGTRSRYADYFSHCYTIKCGVYTIERIEWMYIQARMEHILAVGTRNKQLAYTWVHVGVL